VIPTATKAATTAQAPGAVDPGYTTTEFWQTLVLQVIAAVVAIGTLISKNFNLSGLQAIVPSVAVAAAAAGQLFYSLSRAKVKAAAQNASAQVEVAKATVANSPGASGNPVAAAPAVSEAAPAAPVASGQTAVANAPAGAGVVAAVPAPVPAPPARYGAVTVNPVPPSSIRLGTPVQLTVSATNTGTLPWYPQEGYALTPTGNPPADWGLPSSIDVLPSTGVAPGSSVTSSVTITAASAGPKNISFSITQDGTVVATSPTYTIAVQVPMVAVPNVVNSELTDAETILHALGLATSIRTSAPADVAATTVGSQDPAPGSMLLPGAAVGIDIKIPNNGPQP
jgi:PASTA domain